MCELNAVLEPMKLTITALTADAAHRQPAPATIVEALEALNLKVEGLSFVPDEPMLDPRYVQDEVDRLADTAARTPSRHAMSTLPGSPNAPEAIQGIPSPADGIGPSKASHSRLSGTKTEPTHPGHGAHATKSEDRAPKAEPRDDEAGMNGL